LPRRLWVTEVRQLRRPTRPCRRAGPAVAVGGGVAPIRGVATVDLPPAQAEPRDV